MDYLTVSEIKRWGLSERSVRNYCNQGRVFGATLKGKTWMIPNDAIKPKRPSKKKSFLDILKEERKVKLKGGIYHKVQIELTYNSNHIEGSSLTYEQTRYIYETNTLGLVGEAVNVDDIVETANHFNCVDLIIDKANFNISEKLLKSFIKY